MYFIKRARLGLFKPSSIFLPSAIVYFPSPHSRMTGRRTRKGATPASPSDHRPTTKGPPWIFSSSAGGRSACSSPSFSMSASGVPVPKRKARNASRTLLSKNTQKKRDRASFTGCEGRRPESGKRSATNSTSTRDSESFADSGEGLSGEVGGPPYAIEGNCGGSGLLTKLGRGSADFTEGVDFEVPRRLLLWVDGIQGIFRPSFFESNTNTLGIDGHL